MPLAIPGVQAFLSVCFLAALACFFDVFEAEHDPSRVATGTRWTERDTGGDQPDSEDSSLSFSCKGRASPRGTAQDARCKMQTPFHQSPCTCARHGALERLA